MSVSGGNISSEAAEARVLLDTAIVHFDNVGAGDQTTYPNTLRETLQLISSIQYRNSMQTQPVAEALSQVKGVLERLCEILGQNESLPRMPGALVDLEHAKNNLRANMPNDVFRASGNDAFGSSQNNSLLGGTPLDRPIEVISMNNVARYANQNNGPAYGDVRFFFEAKK